MRASTAEAVDGLVARSPEYETPWRPSRGAHIGIYLQSQLAGEQSKVRAGAHRARIHKHTHKRRKEKRL